MRVILFGATGMVGQGVLRECLMAPEVTAVLAVGRNPLGQSHQKLREIVHKDLANLSNIENELRDYDACFFCLGATSAGLTEAGYRQLTRDLTLGIAQTLNLGMIFIYVSGMGA